jgi:hypothetical protein
MGSTSSQSPLPPHWQAHWSEGSRVTSSCNEETDTGQWLLQLGGGRGWVAERNTEKLPVVPTGLPAALQNRIFPMESWWMIQ